MEADTDNVKVKIGLFYSLDDIGPNRTIKGLDHVRKQPETSRFCCAKCLDLNDDLVEARVVNGHTKLFGRHLGKGKDYCSKIKQSANSNTTKSLNMSYVKQSLEKAISERKLYYCYRTECCLINPEFGIITPETQTKILNDLHGIGVDPKEKNINSSAYFHDYAMKSDSIENVIELEITDDYLLIVTETEKLMFLFNRSYEANEDSFTILEVGKQSLRNNVDKYYDTAGLSPIILTCVYSNKNKCKICPRCLEYNQRYLDGVNHMYIPEKYKNKYSIVPEKSRFIMNNHIHYPEQIIKLLEKYRHDIQLTHSNPTSALEHTDNIYDLVYGLTFTPPIMGNRSYNFYEALFLLILKQSPNHKVDELDSIVKSLLTHGFDKYFKYKPNDKALQLYNELIKPLLIGPEQLEEIARHREQTRRIQQRQYLMKRAERVADWTLKFGKYKELTYYEVIHSDPSYLKFIYDKGRWHNESFPENRFIKEYVESNLYKKSSYEDDGELDHLDYLEIEKSCGL